MPIGNGFNMVEVANLESLLNETKVNLSWKNIFVTDENCSVVVYEHWLEEELADAVFHYMRDTIPWEQQTDSYGKQDRLLYYMGDSGAVFEYKDLRLEPKPWDPVSKILQKLVSETVEEPMTACMFNRYPQSGGSIAWHYDEVRAHGEKKIVISLSLGGIRSFEMKHQVNPDRHMKWFTGKGSLLVMSGDTQSNWLHRIPFEKDLADERISLTFRSIVIGFEDELRKQKRIKIE